MKFPINTQDFTQISTGGYTYVDNDAAHLRDTVGWGVFLPFVPPPVRKVAIIAQSFLLLFCLLAHGLAAQNLIPNPSFENCTQLGSKWMFTRAEFDSTMQAWTSPNDGSPDILFDKTMDRMHPIRPHVDLSAYTPHTGRMMVGLKTYGCAQNSVHCKEYLQVATASPLLPGRSYLFTGWARILHNGVQTGALGLALSPTAVDKRGHETLFDMEVIPCPTDTTHADWQPIQCRLIPQDTMRYLLFGNFLPDENVSVPVESAAQVPYTYWLLDDFALIDETVPTEVLMELADVNFATNAHHLTPAGKELLASWITDQGTGQNLIIVGHTDAIGTEAYNLRLSIQRAQAVADYLAALGLDASITIMGKGASHPKAPNNTPEGRAQNRRVEIVRRQ